MLRFSCFSQQLWEDLHLYYGIHLSESIYSYFFNAANVTDYKNLTGFSLSFPCELYTCIKYDERIIAMNPICNGHIWTYAVFKEMLQQIKNKFVDISISGGIRLSSGNDRRVIYYYSRKGNNEIIEYPGYLKETKRGYKDTPITNSWFHVTYNTWHGEYWYCIENPLKAVQILEKFSIKEWEESEIQWQTNNIDEWTFDNYKKYCDKLWEKDWPIYCEPIFFIKVLFEKYKSSRRFQQLVNESLKKDEIICIFDLVNKKTSNFLNVKTDKNKGQSKSKKTNIENGKTGFVTKEELLNFVNTIFSECENSDDKWDLMWKGGFLKIYCNKQNSNNIKSDFLKYYNALISEYDSMLAKYYDDCDIYYSISYIKNENAIYESDGLIINFGSFSMTAYGRPIPDLSYSCIPEETMKILARKYKGLMYEGIYTICQDEVEHPYNVVVGNVLDYSFTRKYIEHNYGQM